MKCLILFSGKNMKNIANLWSVELDQRMVKFNQQKEGTTCTYFVFFLISLLAYIPTFLENLVPKPACTSVQSGQSLL